MGYKHLSLEDRHYIKISSTEGKSQSTTARLLNRSQSTISRELRRNSTHQGYVHWQAENLAKGRHAEKTKVIKITKAIKEVIGEHLKRGWSPEQISGRLKKEGLINLHPESIYRYILRDKQAGGEYYKYLRHKAKKYRKRYGTAHNRTGIPNRVDIAKRPQIANDRKRIGDWEADTMIGKNHKGAIVTLDERKSKLRLAMPLKGKKAVPVAAAIIVLMQKIERFVKTITFDNGKEFSHHELIAKSLECKTYFATPYHSWERGQNENANGLLREYFPKKMELDKVKMDTVFKAVHRLNSRPRKCLGFKTPYEAFQQFTGVNVESLLGYALMG